MPNVRHETRVCPICGIEKNFPVRNVTCSNACGRELMRRKMAPSTDAVPSPLDEQILTLLKGGKRTVEDLADELDRGPRIVSAGIDRLREKGYNLSLRPGGAFDLSPHVEPGTSHVHEINTKFGDWYKFGATGDNHLGNRHQRLDVLNALYDIYADDGIKAVYNTGNWIDGEARFNRNELLVFGMDGQIDYMVQNYPQRKGITTYLIAGDDHEGWYQQRECIEIGRYLEMRARQAGRTDLVYLGYQEANVQLTMSNGMVRTLRVSHPGGGSAYALSYKGQKYAESLQGGEKPHIVVQGHYHKFNCGYPREVWVVDTGTTCDQTGFMRKKQLQAMVGGTICALRSNEDGTVWRFQSEFIPFYDRNLYERAWSAKGAA